MAVAMLDDIVGWTAFSAMLGPMRGHQVEVAVLGQTVALAITFAVICLGPGRRIVDHLIGRLEAQPDQAAGRGLSFVAVLAMLGAAFTPAIGIHAVLGGFIVGVMVGDSRRACATVPAWPT